jgi:hypothetical protein
MFDYVSAQEVRMLCKLQLPGYGSYLSSNQRIRLELLGLVKDGPSAFNLPLRARGSLKAATWIKNCMSLKLKSLGFLTRLPNETVRRLGAQKAYSTDPEYLERMARDEESRSVGQSGESQGGERSPSEPAAPELAPPPMMPTTSPR